LSPIPLSPIPRHLLAATAGVAAGLGLSGALLWYQHRALTRARHDATHDDTTGLPNRRAALAHLHRALKRGQPTGVVLLDVDHFKTINDTWGHDTGNQVLTELGRRLLTLPMGRVLAARLSGDEFVLIVGGGAGYVRAAARAAFDAVASVPVAVGGDRLPVTVSVGYTQARPGATVAGLLHQADQAMYHAKTTGGGVHGPPTAATGTAHTGRGRQRRHR
jgi:diguanylate cyclase (GGDEF)-like protein